VTHLLLELAEQYGHAASEGIELRIGLSHQDLANIIGRTRETVTVVLGQLQLEGMVRVKRRRITLRDTKRLAESVDRPIPELPARQTTVPSQPLFLAAQTTT
jgi:Mn-dependent DtxR family transcriptional regulator